MIHLSLVDPGGPGGFGAPPGPGFPPESLPRIEHFSPLDPYPGVTFLVAIISLVLCIRVWYGSKKSLSRGVAFYLALVFLLDIFKFAEFIIASPEDKFGALMLQWLGIAYLPCAFLIIAKALIRKPLNGIRLASALIPGTIAIAFVWTNHLHLGFWSNDVRFLPPAEYSPAPGYWVFSAYSFAQIAIAFGIMIAAAYRARGLSKRWMRRLVFILIFPTATNVVFVLLGGSRTLVDPTPLAFALSGALMARTLKAFDIFEEIPYAKGVLLESINSPIVVVDSEGLIIGANEEAMRFSPSGASPEGMGIADFIPVLGERIEVGEARVWTYAGIEYLISCYETKRTREWWKSRIFLFRDITELVEAQRGLDEARARAEAANAAKSAFIATVSHELRNPLNAIISLVDLNLKTELPSQLREDLEVVHSSGNVILGLVNDLLDLSKIEAGRMELEAADFDLHEKVLSIVRAFRPAAEKKGISLDVDIEDGTPRFVNGDALRFGQILMNLVSNAIKFTESGAVLVDIGPIKAAGSGGGAEGRGPGIAASVSDTGIGIPAEGLPLLFKEFSQVDRSIGRRFGGTGLGLSICKKLVDLFGGEIEVSSNPGEGSVFSFTALFKPAAAPEAAAAASAPAAAGERSEGERLLVLVVDDDPVNAAIARRYLDRLGHSSASARTGEEAISLASSARPDLILLDLGLPDMDGFEVCRRIRGDGSDPQSGDLQIVAMTARADPGIRVDCAQAGMIGCLPKPVDPGALEGVLEGIAARSRELGPRAASSVLALPSVAAAEAACPEPPPPETPLIDMPALLARVDGDASFARELLGILVDEAEEKRRALREALGSGDVYGLQKLAHRLKGAALTLCALPLVSSSGRLESACIETGRRDREDGPCSSIEPIADELDDCYRRSVSEAAKYLGSMR